MKATIGLEIHVELNTKSKLFCSCSTDFNSQINTNICEICTGLEGALPRLNLEVVKKAIRLSKALNSKISDISLFDRKNYFYPDLPKGYQITQYFSPFASGGYLDFFTNGDIKRVFIERIQIEEDAGKLIHHKDCTEIDLNRAGVPLLEIVTKPCINSKDEAKEFLKNLRNVFLYTGISDCKMEEGSIRADVNVSLSYDENLGTRVELKNINSFSEIYNAIDYEVNRQENLIKSGGKIIQQTRRWDGKESHILREKQNDYKFIRDFNLLPLRVTKDMISSESVEKLPFERLLKYVKEYNLTYKNASILVNDIEISNFFDELVETEKADPNDAFNYISTDILKYLHKNNKKIENINIKSKDVKMIVDLVNSGEIARNNAYLALKHLMESNLTLQKILDELDIRQISDEKVLENTVRNVVLLNDRAVLDYKNGNNKVLGFLISQCIKQNKRLNPKLLREILERHLKNNYGGNYE